VVFDFVRPRLLEVLEIGPTSLKRGEGRVVFDFVRPRLLEVLEIRPTSLKRGEGPLSGSSRVIGSEWVVREDGGGGGMSGE
jgi:hypothetical protein